MLQETVQILCEGGTHPWFENDIILLEEALEPNGIYGDRMYIGSNDDYYFRVSPMKTKIGSMYTYDELNDVEGQNQDALCWRTFIRLLDGKIHKEWIGWPDIGEIKPLLETIIRIENTA